jgi:hypothetical protein
MTPRTSPVKVSGVLPLATRCTTLTVAKATRSAKGTAGGQSGSVADTAVGAETKLDRGGECRNRGTAPRAVFSGARKDGALVSSVRTAWDTAFLD